MTVANIVLAGYYLGVLCLLVYVVLLLRDWRRGMVDRAKPAPTVEQSWSQAVRVVCTNHVPVEHWRGLTVDAVVCALCGRKLGDRLEAIEWSS